MDNQPLLVTNILSNIESYSVNFMVKAALDNLEKDKLISHNSDL